MVSKLKLHLLQWGYTAKYFVEFFKRFNAMMLNYDADL